MLNCFPKHFYQFGFHQQCKVFAILLPDKYLTLVRLCNCFQLTGIIWYLTVALICILESTKGWTFLHVYRQLWFPLYVNCLFTSFAHFSTELFCSYWFTEIVYITEYWFSLSYMYYKYLTTCLQVVFLLCLLYLFYPQKFLLLKWVEFINLCIYTLGFLSLKKILP